MENLQITATRSTPDIFFNAENGELMLAGESYPENSFDFFNPVMWWLIRYLAKPDCRAHLTIRLTYLNTSSTKVLMDILDHLEDAFRKGRDVSVEWHCDQENDRSYETAKEFGEEVSLPFKIIRTLE